MSVKGALVPIVMIPRFTSFVATTVTVYRQMAINVSAHAGGSVRLWRGPLLGTSPAFAANFESSHDGKTWFGEGSANIDPGENATTVVEFSFTRPLLRISVTLGGSGALGVTCWCSGMLERRVT